MKQLTLDEFGDLPNANQYEIVFEQGVFLERRYEEKSEFSLYAVNSFFVELEYEKEEQLIIGKQAFIAGKSLNDYRSMDSDVSLDE